MRNNYFNRRWWSGFWLACWALTVAAAAEAPQPPAEFWQYLLEFSDQNAALIDPLEFSQLEKLPNNAGEKLPPANSNQNPPSLSAEENLP